MSNVANPFDREPIDRGYRLMALGASIERLVESLDVVAPRGDGEMAIRHALRAIEEEASILIDTLEKAEKRAKIETGGNDAPPAECARASPVADAPIGPITRAELIAVYDTLTLTQRPIRRRHDDRGTSHSARSTRRHGHDDLHNRGEGLRRQEKLQTLIERLEGIPFIGRAERRVMSAQGSASPAALLIASCEIRHIEIPAIR
jgi:hypothetical protein